MDWLKILQEQQQDFIDRLQSHHLLPSYKAGRHGEIITITGKTLEKIKSLCQQLIIKYELDRSRWEYSFIFQQILAQKLAEKAIAYRLSNSIDLLGFKKEYSQKLVANIPLANDSKISLKVKISAFQTVESQYIINSKELINNRVFVFAIIPEKVNFLTTNTEIIIAGFLPSSNFKNTKNKLKINLERLLYSGGLPSYLNVKERENIDPLELAQNCLLIRDYRGTIENLSIALQRDEQQDIAYKTMGYTRYLMGDKEGSIEDYNKAIDLNPNYAEAYLNRADSYYQLENYDKAILDYTEVIKINSYNGSFYIWRGDALCRLGAYDKAILDYNEAIRINPQDYICYVWRAEARLQIKDYQGAIEDYSIAINFNTAKNEDSLAVYVLDSIYFNRGNARYHLGEYQGTIEDYSQAIKINPNYAEAYLKRAIVYYKLGDYQLGVSDYEKATKIDPTFSI
jgi:tetratricopeptide (TPR) repeat protein